MKLLIRILLFILCINLANTNNAFAVDFSDLAGSEKTEVLERDYVQLNIAEDTASTISIFKTFESLVRLLQSKYYSLLKWSLHSRNRDLVIENYDRISKFGRWINDPNDGACYNTRAIVLMRDSNKEVIFKENNKCSVAAGSWNDPYTGQSFDSSTDIQIDHLVPLKNAYLSGAHKWNFKTRCLYANFLGSNSHLLSVNASQNMKKGDRAPDKYMPPNNNYTCTYIKNWLTVKFLWGLRMTTSESQAILTAIKQNNCNLRSFYLTDKEILRQSRFYQDSVDLCDRLDAESKSDTQ